MLKKDQNKTQAQLYQEIDELRARLEEAEEALRAIRGGEIDALVIYGSAGEQVYTLQGADHAYRVMIESISEGAASAMQDGTLLYCNERLAEMLSVPLETLPGSSLSRFVNPEDRQVFESLLKQGQVGSARSEISFKTADGSSLPVLLSVSTAEMAEGWGLCLIATDLTSQKRNEAIVAAERLARSILEQAGEAIVVCDTDGNIIRASQAAAGIIQENPLFQPFERVLPLSAVSEAAAQDAHTERFSIASVLKGGSYKGIEVVFRSPGDAQVRYLLLSAAPLRDEHEEILGCIVTLTDITTQKVMEQALREGEARERAKAAELEAIMDAVPAMIWIARDPECKHMVGNHYGIEFLKMSEGKNISKSAPEPALTEQPYRNYRNGQEIPTIELPMQVAAATGQPAKDYEFDLVFDNGEMRTVFGNVMPLWDDRGQPSGAVAAFTDITERKLAEVERERLLAENKRQKELLERLIQYAPVGIAALYGPEHRFVLANATQHLLFPTISDLVGRTVKDIWAEQPDTFTAILDRVYQTGEPYYAVNAPWQTDRGNGYEEAFYTFSYSPLVDPEGAIEGILVVSVETTDQVRIQHQIEAELAERKRIEQALRESQARLLMTSEAAELGTWSMDVASGSMTFDEKCTALFSLPAGEPITYTMVAQAIHPADRHSNDVAVQSALQNHTPYDKEYRVVWPDGSQHWIHSRGSGVYSADGNPVQMVGVAFDFTRLKQAELEIQSQNIQIEVQHMLIDQLEKERQRISRELHDGPLQDLIAITFDLQNSMSDLKNTPGEQTLKTIQSNLKTQIKNLRTFASDLRPPVLNKFGLDSAIRSYLEKFEDKYPQFKIEFESVQSGSAFPEFVRVALYRILQEAMMNITRHAGATEIKVLLERDQKKVDLIIQDNGRGFVVPTDLLGLAHEGHFGLIGIQERVNAVNGWVEVHSVPGQGTQVHVTVPLTSPG